MKASFNKLSSINPLTPVISPTRSQKLDLPENRSCNSFTLNDIWVKHRGLFEEWLKIKNVSERTKQNYFSALLRFFESQTVTRPIEFRNILLKDKEERGLRNLFNYFEDKEINEICGLLSKNGDAL